MKTSKIVYKGNLRTECTHLKSGQTIITDAPTDNQGKGEAFSPTDLTATSLASCLITTIGIAAQKNNIIIDSMESEATKVMTTDPRRITEVIVEVKISAGSISEDDKKYLEEVGRNCPVAKSLHPDINQNISYRWS